MLNRFTPHRQPDRGLSWAVTARILGALLLAVWLPWCRAELTLAVYPDNPPYLYLDESKPTGLYLDIVTATLDDMQQPYRVTMVPIRRALQMAYDGDAVVAGIVKTDERAQKLRFSEPIYREDIVVFRPADRRSEVETISDLQQLVIGVQLGWSYGSLLDAARHSHLFQAIEGSLRANVLATEQGRLDGFLHSRLSGLYLLSAMHMTNRIVVASPPLERVDVYVAVRKQPSNGFLARFNRHLDALQQAGTLERIRLRYTQP